MSRSERHIRATTVANSLSSFGLALALWAALAGKIHFWDTTGRVITNSSDLGIIIGAIFVAIAVVLNRGKFQQLFSDPLGASLVLVPIFFSDWLTRPYSLFPGPAFRGELMLATCAAWLLLRSASGLYRWWLMLTVLLLCWSFYDASGGRVLFNDDHGSTIYRLQLLKEVFPYIPTYSTLWNAGTDARDFFATGILNVYFLFYPLIHFFEVTSIYNIIVSTIFFILVPAITYVAAEKNSKNGMTASIAALLSLTTSLLWYRWCLKYGSLGFITSSALLPYVIWTIGKLFTKDEELTYREAIIFPIICTLMLFWSMTAVVFIPVAILALLKFKTVIRKRFFGQILIALLVLNLPWMLVFSSVSQVGRFLTLAKPSFTQAGVDAKMAAPSTTGIANERSVRGTGMTLSAKSVRKVFRNFVVTVNPLLIVFFIPGLFVLKPGWRGVYGITIVWLLLLGGVVSPVKPQLELERMLIIASIVACLPAATAIALLRDRYRDRLRLIALGSFGVTGGYLLSGVFAVTSVLYNRTLEHFSFADDLVTKMTSAIREFGGDGRTLYSACILHEVSGGHIAPFAYMGGHPLVASSPIHNIWWYTDVIPQEFRQAGGPGIEHFFDLYNVTAVFAHERHWKEYFQSAPQIYDQVWQDGRFKLYRRNAGVPTYFQEGTGEIINQSSNGITLRLDTAEAIIRFTYFPFLESSACKLSPASFGSDVRLIKISDCSPGTVLSIKAKNAFRRLWDVTERNG